MKQTPLSLMTPFAFFLRTSAVTITAIALGLATISVEAGPISLGGYDLQESDFADVINYWSGGGTLEPGNLVPDPGTGIATSVEDAVLGSNVNKYLNNASVELGFTDNVLTNTPGAFDVLIFDIGSDGDDSGICVSRLALNPMCTGIQDNERILTGFTISTGQLLTAFLIDLADMGVADNAVISSLFLQGSLELAAIAAVTISIPGNGTGDDDTSTIPEPATLALLSLGLVGMGYSRTRRQ